MAADPYQILGVPKDAPHAEIKRAFRRLARQYHPDRNPDDAAAEERFKAVQNAWEQLETPEKRTQYDEEQQMQEAFGGFGGMPGGMGGMDLGDMLRQFMGADSRHSTSPFSQRSRQPSTAPAEPSKGTDLSAPLDIDFERAMNGGKVQFTINRLRRCEECSTSGCIHCSNIGVRRRKSKFTIEVPKGAKHGQQLKLPKMGNEHPTGEPGNLTVTLRIDADEGRRWEGDHLIQEVAVPYSTLMLGGKIRISTPAGRTVSITIAPETRIGDRRRLAKQGFAGGDLDIEFTLSEHEALTNEQREALESLRERGL